MSFTYKGLKAIKERHIITDAEIDHQIQRLQQSNPRIALVKDRAAQLGDEVVLDYAGFCGGEQFAGGTAENQTLVLGSGMFIPGFEEQLVDKVPGEQVSVKVTFPTEYHAPDLAGKEAEFRCVIHEIRVKTPYELDDVFAKEVGGCDTLAEMRQKLQDGMQAYADNSAEMDLQDRLLRQAADTMEEAPTEDAIQAALEEQMGNLQAQLSRQGLSLEMYCSFMQTTPEALEKDMVPAAESSARCQAAITKIVDLEGIRVTPKEMAEAVSVICKENNLTAEQLKPYVNKEFEHAVVRSILSTKVMRLIRDAAEITVKE